MAPNTPKTTRTVEAIVLLKSAGLVAAVRLAKTAVPFAEVSALYPAVSGEYTSWLLSLVSLIEASLVVAPGSLARRLGPANLVLTGLIAGAILSAWQSTEPTFRAMLISRAIEGASHLSIVVAAPVLIARIAHRCCDGALEHILCGRLCPDGLAGFTDRRDPRAPTPGLPPMQASL